LAFFSHVRLVLSFHNYGYWLNSLRDHAPLWSISQNLIFETSASLFITLHSEERKKQQQNVKVYQAREAFRPEYEKVRENLLFKYQGKGRLDRKMMVPKTCRHREHKCYIAEETGCSLRLMFQIFMLFPLLPWIWNYILSLPVQLRHESCLFFESLIWSLCNEHHGSRILPWCPHKFWSHVYARSCQSVPLSMYIWLSLDSPHSSSYFFTIRYSSHLYPPLRNASSSTLMNQISNVKSFQKDTPSERIRVIPLDLQLRRHVYLFYFIFFLSTKERWDS